MRSPADAQCAWITTSRADGSPHTTPVWFILVDDTFWVASAATNVKVRNIAADERVSLAIDGSAADPHVAQGRALVHRDIAAFRILASLFAQKYDGWNPLDESVDGPRVLLEIPVERWLLGGS
ncbi:pyridoxamine 5'-phosphate oxidase family protein [Agreia pratensis]|uniref:Pyridoxamine 5'-phosphate oxidase n=1 Tax=Agreia pratensis TaxID=150121 RepID=A0A1X7KWI8_9MICO|nr:pyridoxamine 5'-phosphate oxidase family protein [Agreia pratensis]SMG45368.1 Pyridoxamine 5'-phosphate oxidase [Agreia pratensis]